MCQAEFVFRQNWILTKTIHLEKSELNFSSQNWLLQNLCSFTDVKHKLSLAEEVVELASVLEQNRPSILEVVEIATALKLDLCLLEEVVELASVL